MMNCKTIVCNILLVIGVIFSSCKEESRTSNKITIATAASTSSVMKELVEEFTLQTSIDCQLVVGSSGKLASQIKEGAPYHLFISANTKYTSSLATNGMTLLPPKSFAQGRLVLWSLDTSVTPSLKTLTSDQIRHITLPNPKIAPYGEATFETLQNLNLKDSLQDKFVYGESVSQCNQFILSKASEIGFTSLSTVLSPQMSGKGKWLIIKEDHHSPILHSIALLKHSSKNKVSAQRFYDFIFSTKAQEILKKFGYSVHEQL